MINTAKELNKALKELPEAKEYFKVKEALLKDEYIISLVYSAPKRIENYGS